MSREERTVEFEIKKARQVKVKQAKRARKEGSNLETQQLLQFLSKVQAKKLLEFMEEKFDQVIARNGKLYRLLFEAIGKRMNELKGNFKQAQRQKLINFVAKHANRTPTEKELAVWFDKPVNNNYWQRMQTSPEVNVSSQFHKDYNMLLRVSIKSGSNLTQYIYVGREEDEIMKPASFKRFKAETITSLEKFIELKDKVANISIQE